MALDPATLRRQLDQAKLLLLFTPALCGNRDPLLQLLPLLPLVDLVQVRSKPLGASSAPAPARETLELARVVLELARSCPRPPLVLVDDRVDVARVLWDEGLAGVHLGADDMPPAAARGLLGSAPLLGLSTHSLTDVVRAEAAPVDYLGFGPVHATATKAREKGLGSEQAWIAAGASARPLFPIGGIDGINAAELQQVGRAAVGSALLGADDPARAAGDLLLALTDAG